MPWQEPNKTEHLSPNMKKTLKIENPDIKGNEMDIIPKMGMLGKC